ncbi:efflux RND transporter periplasmic adaptor subunit [Pseudorhodoferax sp. Leaf267]|uniref:efflux RND transporter periplasmic adaptor subunit n=1 Tax=Pseudorhodoferax sp. Leaf267 TaxID=1736316 RepID=UPI0006F4F98C|nr:efflux RND transporter periplasmic adaptor subunit [Pseudorhodoferax sp. Leaf267]KQP17600.1 hypothetical protein ASF43_06805 [Pseudorhodoferax sp. Leaf267]
MHTHPPLRPHEPAARRRPLVLASAVLAAAPWAVDAQQQPATSPPMQALACLILPSQVADVGSAVIGVVETLEVERGDAVRKGQILARLRSDVERANADLVRSRAQSEAELRGAEAGRELAQLRLDRARSLKEENFVSTQAVEQAHAEYKVANERLAQARDALRTAARELVVSSAQTDQRVLRAPFDGVIVERYANLGERFEDKPLVKIAAIAHLRVEVVAPTTLFGQLRQGQQVQVVPELAGTTPRSARIAQIDQVLDPASNTFRLRLDLPNADHALPAGLRCKVDLGLRAAAPATLTPTGTATR